MARKLKIAEQHSLKQNSKDSRGRIAVWLVGKNRWAWRSPVDVREMLGMGQALLEAPAGSPPKPTPENPYPDGYEEESQYSDDDGDESEPVAAQALTAPPPAPPLAQPAQSESTSSGRARSARG